MAAFPTIYLHATGTDILHPVVESMDSTLAHDPTIRSISEGGYVTTRARFTRMVERWNVRYEWMSNIARTGDPDSGQKNKDTLAAFEKARKAGAELFTWTNPVDDTAYVVRFLEPMHYTPHAGTNFLWWTVEFILEQV